RIVGRCDVIPRRLGRAVVALAAVVAVGCSGGPARPAVYPVRGQVFVNKTQPAAGALVVFHPLSAEVARQAAARPFAYVRDDGSFQLTTYNEGDGAPAGEYGVTVVWEAVPKSGGPRIREGGTPDRLGGRYGDPNSPKLKVTVQPQGENNFRL